MVAFVPPVEFDMDERSAPPEDEAPDPAEDGPRRYTCSDCGASFAQSSSMYRHKKKAGHAGAGATEAPAEAPEGAPAPSAPPALPDFSRVRARSLRPSPRPKKRRAATSAEHESNAAVGGQVRRLVEGFVDGTDSGGRITRETLWTLWEANLVFILDKYGNPLTEEAMFLIVSAYLVGPKAVAWLREKWAEYNGDAKQLEEAASGSIILQCPYCDLQSDDPVAMQTHIQHDHIGGED